MSDKPREFFLEFSDLCYDEHDCKVTVREGTDANVEPNEKIHVIEYSAYEELLRWKKEAFETFKPIFDFEHSEMKLGDSKVQTVLRLANERDRLKAALEEAREIIRVCHECTGRASIYAKTGEWLKKHETLLRE